MKNIIIVDDDPINNYLCELTIKTVYPNAQTQSFTNPVFAFSTLTNPPVDSRTTILLDLNMPEMNGWQFLEKFEQKNISCTFYILTSSVNPVDKEKAQKHPIVAGFLSKPISSQNVVKILSS